MEKVLKKLSIASWVLAARPKTLTAGIIPVAVGTLLTDLSFYDINWFLAFCALLCSFTIQIATNLVNDALDFKKGADTKERLGPVRVTQAGILKPEQVLKAAFLTYAFALICSIPLILKGGDILIWLIVASIVCSYIYTGGPLPLAYVGLGEVFVILFYGFFATSTSYFLQTGNWGGLKLFFISLELGLLISLLLAINNLRDHEEDRKSNKKTLAVRFGVEFARKEIAFLASIPFIINFFWIFTEDALLFFLPMTTLPLAISLVKRIFQFIPGRIYNRFLGDASLLILLYGTLLILGSRLM